MTALTNPLIVKNTFVINASASVVWKVLVNPLTVTQGDYSTAAEDARRYQETYNNGEGWNPILREIKKLAEG